jgi:hypothetical protein
MSCHQEIPDKDLAVSLLYHIKEVSDIKIDKEKHNSILHKLVLIGAWGQVLGIFALIGAVFGVGYLIIKRKRK